MPFNNNNNLHNANKFISHIFYNHAFLNKLIHTKLPIFCRVIKMHITNGEICRGVLLFIKELHLYEKFIEIYNNEEIYIFTEPNEDYYHELFGKCWEEK